MLKRIAPNCTGSYGVDSISRYWIVAYYHGADQQSANVSKMIYCRNILVYVCMTHLFLHTIIIQDHELHLFTNILEYHHFWQASKSLWNDCLFMTTSSNGNIFRVTGLLRDESTGHKGQWHRALMFFLDLRLNERLTKQSICRCIEMPSCSLWRHCNVFSTSCSQNLKPIISLSQHTSQTEFQRDPMCESISVIVRWDWSKWFKTQTY